MKHYSNKSAMNAALYDMSKEFITEYMTMNHLEVWFVFPSQLLNKHTRYLNKTLGLNKLNYTNNKNAKN